MLTRPISTTRSHRLFQILEKSGHVTSDIYACLIFWGRDVPCYINVITFVIAELMVAEFFFCDVFLTFIWYDILKVYCLGEFANS